MNWPKWMCLTTDEGRRSHPEQVQALCSAGVDWIQLRTKHLRGSDLESIASECLVHCREAGITFVLNDHLDLALKIEADGVHLGTSDTPWSEARERAGSDFLIGGTVNSVKDAKMVVASGVPDYVGVGPFKFTRTKQKLAPVLTDSDWASIVNILGELPGYAIGGIEDSDLPEILRLGVRGVAVCSALYRGGDIAQNYQKLLNAYEK